MPETSTDLLLECLAEALETFAFAAIEPLEGPPRLEQADLYTLAFRGAASGRFSLAAPRALGGQIAATLTATEPGDPQAAQRAQDVMKELCNIVTGLWLSRRWPDATPELGLPASEPLLAAAEFAARPGAMAVLAEGHPVVVQMEENA